MAKKEFNLGDSLAVALGNVSDPDQSEQITYVDITLIDEDKNNFYSMDGIDELAASIELVGLQQPVRLRENPDMPGRYLLVSGHRRRRAFWSLYEENPEKWRRIAAIIEKPAASPELQELRLILANADTRRMSSADLAKQVERVQMLLYKLKEEGVIQFSGRMRDAVAEACKVSSTKLAMLKVIREKLAEPYVPLYESGKLTESSAYAIAQADARAQDRLRNYWAPTEIAEQPEWWISSKIRYMTECYNRKCKATDGFCEHADTMIDRKMRNPNRYVDCEYQKCCANCPKVGTCKTACAYVADTQAAMREAEKKEKERAKAEAAEHDRRRAQEKAEERKKNTADWQRFWNAAKAAGMDEDAFMTSLCISQEWWNDTVKRNSRAELRRRIEGSWDEGVDGYGQIEDSPLVYLEDPEDYIDIANVLHCSTDYLLGRTEELTPSAAPPQQTDATPLRSRSGTPEWISTNDALPKQGCEVLILDEDGYVDLDRIDRDGRWFYSSRTPPKWWAPIPPAPGEDPEPYYAEPVTNPEPRWQQGDPLRPGRYLCLVDMGEYDIHEQRCDWTGSEWRVYGSTLDSLFTVKAWYPLPDKNDFREVVDLKEEKGDEE